MLWLHQTDRLAEEGPDLPEGEIGEGMARLLATAGWVEGDGGAWTAAGRQAGAFALNFGGVATYLPLLGRLPELFRGELNVAPAASGETSEWHVHRGLNVAISANAHRRYFADTDALFVELFDRAGRRSAAVHRGHGLRRGELARTPARAPR